MADSTADPMADKSLWQSPRQLMVLLKDQFRLLRPGQKPSDQQMNHLYNICGSLKNAVDAVRDATRSEGPRAPLSADYEALFGHLSEIERVDAEWRWLQNKTQSLERSHKKHMRREGRRYPNNLSLRLVQQLSLCLPRLMQPMDICRFHLRCKINELARDTLRPLNVLDFPDETLMQIFHFVRYNSLSKEGLRFFSQSSSSRQNTRVIQNARLTCRRFCATSSHLLIDHINLGIQTASLSHLRKISQHPTISRGIRGVTIYILPYNPEPAESLQTFASIWARQLGECAAYERPPEHGPRRTSQLLRRRNHSMEPYGNRLATFKKLDSVQQAWQELANNPDGVPESNVSVEALQTCYAEYERRYRDQQHLLESGFFVEATAIALAQMPLAQKLEFDDCPFKPHNIRTVLGVANNPLAIGKTFLEPLSVPGRIELGLECKVPLDMIVTLLGALPGAGAMVKDVEINLQSACNAALLAPDPTARRKLVLLAKQLKSISLLLEEPHRSQYVHAHAQSALEGAHQFLSAVSDTDSLESFTFCIDEKLWKNSTKEYSVGPALNSRERKRLNFLELSEASIRGDELVQLLSSFEPCHGADTSAGPVLEISFNAVRLLSGLWADVVEALHGRVTSNSCLARPLGGECSIIPQAAYDRLFTTDGVSAIDLSEPSPVERYIRDRHPETPNPLYTDPTRYFRAP